MGFEEVKPGLSGSGASTELCGALLSPAWFVELAQSHPCGHLPNLWWSAWSCSSTWGWFWDAESCARLVPGDHSPIS